MDAPDEGGGEMESFTLCKICLQSDDVIWFCKTCSRSICIRCKLNHADMNPTHEVEMINNDEEVEELSVGTCQKHPDAQLNKFCDECNVACCPKCVEEIHGEDTIKSVYESLKHLRFQVVDLVQDLRKQLLHIEESIRTWARNASEYFDVLRGRRNQIIFRFSKFEAYQEFSKLLGEELHKYDQLHQADVEHIHSLRLDLEQKHADMKALLSKLENAMEADHPDFIATAPTLLRQHKGVAVDLPSGYMPVCKDVNMRKIDAKITPLVKMLEKKAISLQIAHSFPVEFTPHQIVPVSAHRAWVGASPKGRISHFSYSGEEIQYLDTCFKIHDFKIQHCGTFVFALTDWTTHCLKKITSQDRLRVSVVVENFHPYEPRGMCVNDLNQIVVCLIGPHGKLGIYNSYSGTKVGEIQKKAFGVPLFSNPVRVMQNYNGDYHVIDEKENIIVTVNREGVYLWSYNGQQGDRHGKGYCPKDLCCDSFLNIISTDVSNDVVHIVNRYGQYVTHLDTKSFGISGLHSIAIDNQSKLWLSAYFHKKVYVVEYMKCDSHCDEDLIN